MSMFMVNNDAMFQIIAAALGSVGLAMLFNVRGKYLVATFFGAFITWAIYVYENTYRHQNVFISMLVSAMFVALFAQIMARIHKAPATIYLTTAAIPLVPGGRLYYTMEGSLTGNRAVATDAFLNLLIICLAIALGYIVVDIVMSQLMKVVQWWKTRDIVEDASSSDA